MERNIRIVLVEDHPEYREVVELALDKEPDMELVSQFGSAESALRCMQNLEHGKEPDVILLDLNLPGMNGLDSISWLKDYVPKSKIIVLTQSNKEADILRAITLGASGYLLKSSSVNQIKEGIRMVSNGGASLDANIARFILTTLKAKLPNVEMEQPLSEREMEVLKLLGEGFLKKEIADHLRISISTVVTHVAHIYEKLHVQNAPAAVAKAFRMGIFSPGKED
ncbi:MAG: response regulator transcription factor [Verrucomicrobia bacterium]|nr:response regulator transcription factor [Verrucomicrobiota bacterium]